jgi:hypothetical protein
LRKREPKATGKTCGAGLAFSDKATGKICGAGLANAQRATGDRQQFNAKEIKKLLIINNLLFLSSVVC